MGYPILLSQGWSQIADQIDGAIFDVRKELPQEESFDLIALVEQMEATAHAFTNLERKTGTIDDVRLQLIQVAAMAIMLIQATDVDFNGDTRFAH